MPIHATCMYLWCCSPAIPLYTPIRYVDDTFVIIKRIRHIDDIFVIVKRIRYVDDTFVIIKRTKLEETHKLISNTLTGIKFTREEEKNK
eukprot:g38732.t1